MNVANSIQLFKVTNSVYAKAIYYQIRSVGFGDDGENLKTNNFGGSIIVLLFKSSWMINSQVCGQRFLI